MHLLDDFEKNRQTRVWAWDRKGEYKVTEKDELQGEKGERTWIGGEKKRVVWDKKRKIFFQREVSTSLRECTFATYNEVSNYIWNLQGNAWSVIVAVLHLEIDLTPCDADINFLFLLLSEKQQQWK